MAVAAGSTLPDQGIVEIGGHVMEQPSPATAQALGLAVVYQHLSILEDLTVAETMVFAMPRGRRPSLLRAGPWARRKLAVVGADDRSRRARERAERGRPPARRDRQGAGARAEGARARRAHRVADAASRAPAVRPGARASPLPARPSSTSPTACPRCSASPTASRCCATARRGAPCAAEGVSEAEILRLIIGRSVDQAFPAKARLAPRRRAAPERERALGPALPRRQPRRPARRDRRARGRRGQRPARVPARARRAPARERRRRARGQAGDARRSRRACSAPASSTCPATATPKACCCR